jgi:hypothetical protein
VSHPGQRTQIREPPTRLPTTYVQGRRVLGWCITEHRIGVITGEVGAGKTVALRAVIANGDFG